MSCFDLLNDYAIVAANDSPDDRRDAVLAHLSNGEYVSAPHTPSPSSPPVTRCRRFISLTSYVHYYWTHIKMRRLL